MKAVFVAVVVLAAFVGNAHGLYFFLEEGIKKCFVEMVPEDIRFVASYSSPDLAPQNAQSPGAATVGIRATVVDPHGKAVVDKMLAAEGRLALQTFHGGDYQLCFLTNTTAPAGADRRKFRLHLRVDVGEGAVDYTRLAEKEHLSNLAVEVRKLSDKLSDILNQQSFQRDRETSFRQSSEDTYQQLQMWSIFQTAVLIASAVWQLVHLKAFVLQKKLA